jgi:hypothetical protein
MATVGEGGTMAAHLRQAAKCGAKVEGLDHGEPPPELRYLWSMFLELNSARGSNGFAPAAISFTELQAYQMAYQLKLRPYEVKLIRRLDHVWFECLPETPKR